MKKGFKFSDETIEQRAFTNRLHHLTKVMEYNEGFCMCGCGGEVKLGSKYLHGHNGKTEGHKKSCRERQIGIKLSEERIKKRTKTRKITYPKKEKINIITGLCKCGCGNVVYNSNTFFLQHAGRYFSRGIKRGPLSAETKLKKSLQLKGKPRKVPLTKESILKMKESRKYQKNTWFTKPEKIVMDKLQNNNIIFNHHKYIDIKHGYQCDFYLPDYNIVLECDGDYWHNLSHVKEKDLIRTREMIEKGYIILRFWEHKIKSSDFNLNKEMFENICKINEGVWK